MEREPKCPTCGDTGETPNVLGVYRDGPQIKWEDCAACGGYGGVPDPERMRHYAAIAAEAARAGWLVHYQRDLTQIDQLILHDVDPAEPFGWILRESGTHLFLCRYQYLHGWKSIARSFAGPGHRFYVWTGRALHELANSEVFERWVREHAAPACTACNGSGEIDRSYQIGHDGYGGTWHEHTLTCAACHGTGGV